MLPLGDPAGGDEVSDGGNRAIVERYAAALPGDFAALSMLRHPDFVEEWPQSGERIRGHANYQAIHEHYPGGLAGAQAAPDPR